MPQSLARVYFHIVFSTKNREPWLKDEAICAETHAYLAGIAEKLDCEPVACPIMSTCSSYRGGPFPSQNL